MEDVKRINKQKLIPKKSREGFKKRKDKSKYRLPPRKFDPNEYSEDEWSYLGLSKKQIAVVMKFVKSGIYSNEALKKIYVFPEKLLGLIKDSTFYPNVPVPIIHSDEVFLSNKTIDVKPILELNSVDSAQLVSLRGIGPFYAGQILKYRNKIGGYYKIEQLLEVWKMRTETYEALTEQLVVDSDQTRKLRLNTVSFHELYEHPYLSYAQANSIIKMRAQSNGFKHVSEIKLSKLIDSNTFDKLIPYLVLE